MTPATTFISLTIPCMNDGDLVEVFEDPGYRKWRNEIALTIAN